MKCDNCEKRHVHLNRVWCSTWVNLGPLDVCDDCAKVFMPSHYKGAEAGEFYWGVIADEKYQEYLKNTP